MKLKAEGSEINFSLVFDNENYQVVVSNNKEKILDSCQTRHFSCEESDSPETVKSFV